MSVPIVTAKQNFKKYGNAGFARVRQVEWAHQDILGHMIVEWTITDGPEIRVMPNWRGAILPLLFFGWPERCC